MGGRWLVTTVQVTFILKGELDKEARVKFFEWLREQYVASGVALDVLLDEHTTQDVEV